VVASVWHLPSVCAGLAVFDRRPDLGLAALRLPLPSTTTRLPDYPRMLHVLVVALHSETWRPCAVAALRHLVRSRRLPSYAFVPSSLPYSPCPPLVLLVHLSSLPPRSAAPTKLPSVLPVKSLGDEPALRPHHSKRRSRLPI
jgi:hypothetical protein